MCVWLILHISLVCFFFSTKKRKVVGDSFPFPRLLFYFVPSLNITYHCSLLTTDNPLTHTHTHSHSHSDVFKTNNNIRYKLWKNKKRTSRNFLQKIHLRYKNIYSLIIHDILWLDMPLKHTFDTTFPFFKLSFTFSFVLHWNRRRRQEFVQRQLFVKVKKKKKTFFADFRTPDSIFLFFF